MDTDSSAELRPALYAATALSALDVAVSHWDATGRTRTLGDILDRAFTTAFNTPRLNLAADRAHD